MTVIGDPGVGKTRVVAEALNVDGLSESVLYVNDATDAGRMLALFRRSSASSGILIADEIEGPDIKRMQEQLGGLQGRWRLVGIHSRTSPREVTDAAGQCVVAPLSSEAMEQLILEHSGLDEERARSLVARVAQGFPDWPL